MKYDLPILLLHFVKSILPVTAINPIKGRGEEEQEK